MIDSDKKTTLFEGSNKQKLQRLAHNSNRILYLCKTVFPFTLFPDFVTVDQTKVVIKKSTFFLSNNIVTVLIRDIRLVEVDTGPLFATFRLEVAGFDYKVIKVPFLQKNDAIQLKKIVMGLIVAQQQNIDLKKISKRELIYQTRKIGSPSRK